MGLSQLPCNLIEHREHGKHHANKLTRSLTKEGFNTFDDHQGTSNCTSNSIIAFLIQHLLS